MTSMSTTTLISRSDGWHHGQPVVRLELQMGAEEADKLISSLHLAPLSVAEPTVVEATDDAVKVPRRKPS